jgi:precorrin-6A/cobalt-precorrin-6A reductase
MHRLRVLILGGAAESFELAEALAREPRCEPTLSLAGVTRAPRVPAVPWRSGGFGGIDGLARYLARERVNLLVSATHPFAAQMRRHAIEAARQVACPLLILERPAWSAQPGDRWVEVPDMSGAAFALGQAPRRVFLTIGRKELGPFATQPQHTYLIRTIEPPPPEQLPCHRELILARGPFAEADERALLIQHRIDLMVSKNSGGAATEAKLHAARDCGVTVIMVARPPRPSLTGVDAHVTDTAAGAMRYFQARHPASFSTQRVV